MLESAWRKRKLRIKLHKGRAQTLVEQKPLDAPIISTADKPLDALHISTIQADPETAYAPKLEAPTCLIQTNG